MKKIITATLAGALIFSGSIASNQTEAATQTKVNYLSKTTAKKILTGKYVYGGMKLGASFKYYSTKSKYGFTNSHMSLGDERRNQKKYADKVYYNGKSNLDSVFGHSDLQEKVSFSKKKVSRVKLWVRDNYEVTPKQMQKVYGKPKYTAKSGASCCFVRAEIYNNATLYYYIPFNKSQKMKLVAIDMYKYKGSTEMKKFAKYLNKKGTGIDNTITKAKYK